MSRYSDLGLDEKKVSRTPGKKEKFFYCLWCHSNPLKGYYMCFENWVCCEHCAASGKSRLLPRVDPVEDKCFKCNDPGAPGKYGMESSGTPLWLCEACISEAHRYLSPPKPASVIFDWWATKK